MKYKLLLLAGFLLSTIFSANAQLPTIINKFNQRNIGISIKKTDFDKKVSLYMKRMGDWTKFSTREYIDMVRVYNTIGGNLPVKNDFYKMYYTVFLVMYCKPAAKQLDAQISKGMAMYSKKYDLWLGDVPLGNGNSRFKIDTLQ